MKEGNRWVCRLCPVHCKMREGDRGICRGREIIDDVPYAVNYGEVVALHIDPIEKKPLYHVKPGQLILSAGPNGCNLHCKWCQNYEISQADASTTYVAPEAMADKMVSSGSIGLAYTYTEPLIWFEYILDTAKEVHDRGGINVLVTNGYIEKEPLTELIPFIDAANVDLKSIDDQALKKSAGASVDPVLRSIQMMVDGGVHVEVTHLVVTGFNDSFEHFDELLSKIKGINRHIPLHLSRYFPQNRWNEPPSDTLLLYEFYRKAENELDFVYLGNMASKEGNHTYCPNCQSLLIERSGYRTVIRALSRDGKCKICGEQLAFLL